MRFSHGRLMIATPRPSADNSSAARQALVISTGPYPTIATCSPGFPGFPDRNVTPRPVSRTYDAGSVYGTSSGTLTNRRYVLASLRSTAHLMASRDSRSQQGSIAVRPGTEPMAEMSRTDWCEWPGPPGIAPARVAVEMIFRRSVAVL